jgi:putative DNA primase/helicase
VAVTEATKAYLEVQDALSAWLAEYCEFGASFEDTAARLFGSWKAYAERTGEPAQSQKAFAPKLEARGFQRYRTTEARGYRGLRLKSELAPEPHWTDRG